jgi:hypothetical protein
MALLRYFLPYLCLSFLSLVLFLFLKYFFSKRKSLRPVACLAQQPAGGGPGELCSVRFLLCLVKQLHQGPVFPYIISFLAQLPLKYMVECYTSLFLRPLPFLFSWELLEEQWKMLQHREPQVSLTTLLPRLSPPILVGWGTLPMVPLCSFLVRISFIQETKLGAGGSRL